MLDMLYRKKPKTNSRKGRFRFFFAIFGRFILT